MNNGTYVISFSSDATQFPHILHKAVAHKVNNKGVGPYIAVGYIHAANDDNAFIEMQDGEPLYFEHLPASAELKATPEGVERTIYYIHARPNSGLLDALPEIAQNIKAIERCNKAA